MTPARKTRRAQTERRQSITTPSTSAPVALAPPRSPGKTIQTPKIIAPEREKGKSKADGPKPKAKEKHNNVETFSDKDEENVRHCVTAHRKASSRADAMSASAAGRRLGQDGEIPSANGKRKIAIGAPGMAIAPRRSDRRKALSASTAATQNKHVSEGMAAQHVSPFLDSNLHATWLNALDLQLDVLPVAPTRRPAQTDELAERPKFKIKRIKLIVRPPPLRISHPAQRPPQPKFGPSLNAFLSSYVTPFEQVIDEAALERQIQKEAALFERAYWVRKEGRFLPASEDMTTESLNELRKSSFTPKRNSKDVWEHVVESVVAHRRTKKRGPGQQIAGQIAAKIKGYWDAQEVKKEKIKAITEKQLRTLARDTMKMVVNEWKKAVFVRALS